MFDSELVSRFEWLRHIGHGDLGNPPLFIVFDLLQLEEKDYRPEPLKVLKVPEYRVEERGFYKP